MMALIIRTVLLGSVYIQGKNKHISILNVENLLLKYLFTNNCAEKVYFKTQILVQWYTSIGKYWTILTGVF